MKLTQMIEIEQEFFKFIASPENGRFIVSSAMDFLSLCPGDDQFKALKEFFKEAANVMEALEIKQENVKSKENAKNNNICTFDAHDVLLNAKDLKNYESQS